MAWIGWGLFLSFSVFLSPSVRVSAERQQAVSGFRRLYVLQPGPVVTGPGSAGANGGVRVSSISTSLGPSGRPHTYSVELTANMGGQVRSRRMGIQAAPAPRQEKQQQQLKLSGVNVCGGQCCHGWSKAQGSQRCTKPICIPQCQNGGMCLRPQLCVCKPGSKGEACEQKTVPTHPFPAGPGSGATNGHTTVHSNAPQRPIPQQVSPNGYVSAPQSSGSTTQMKVTLKPAPQFVRPHYIHQHIQQQIRPMPVNPGQTQQYFIKPKYYHKHTTHTQTHVHTQPERPIPLTMGHSPFHVGNHTGRIKVVFTPTICKLTCVGGRCHNNCELGNTTTIISENGHATDTLTAPNFRVVVCHLPCINGGRCSARDKCQCPPNFTGKFCQMPVQSGHQQTSGGHSQTQVHSTHTLPLTYGNGQTPVYNPSFVNIHIKHPPEASVQVHQVSQVDDYNSGHKDTQTGSSSSTGYRYHHSESSQKVQHHGYNVVYPGHHGYHVTQYQPVSSKNTLGRCFQETAGSQCGKALPGLSKLEQCCGTIGTSWGFHKCQKCPKKPSIPLIDCPQGYKRVNGSHCQDLDECQLQGVCPHGNCMNTMGSYRCICKPGYVPDPTFTTCISKFKEICPGGMGYTVLPNPPVNKQVTVPQQPTELEPPRPLPTPERPVEAFGEPDIIPEVVERTSPPAPVEILPSNAGQDIAPTQSEEVDECQISPYICGQGTCYNTAEGYTCHCNEGYRLDDTQTTCVDVDECAERTACPSGVCFNEPGGYHCETCPDGFSAQGGQCVDIDECQDELVCVRHYCVNTEGSFMCLCASGFRPSPAGDRCDDIDECQDERVCIRGHCQNTEGSFMCLCGPGFRVSPAGDQCDDVDECIEDVRACGAVGECVNEVGSYMCTCPRGFRQINGTRCTDVDECVEGDELCSPHGKCLNTEGSYQCVCDDGFSATHDTPSCEDIDECNFNETICGVHGFCENRLGSFRCVCDQGYQESQDGQSCVDVNECELLSSVCGEAQCVNIDGTFLCMCPSGEEYNVMIAKCEPVPTASSVERKECYYHLSDENLCESVLTSQATLQECCCTLGAGWGDNCEVYPCPVNGTDQFNQMCPSGRGFVPKEEWPYGATAPDSYRDADECTLFGEEVCKEGFCLNTEGGYECYCKSGHDYDPVRLECRDIDECLDESRCTGGQCINTDGSYMCFCTHPMIMDSSRDRCVFVSGAAVEHEVKQTDYQGICWQTVKDMTCMRPLGPDRKTTFTECCCLYGEAWGMDCALCPPRNTEDYATMCNLRVGGGRHPYGQDALVAGPVHEYEVGPDYSPSEQPPFYKNEKHPYRGFEGLQVEECGILNGCENGRCVRVQEGYTCDCLVGYTLDLSRMACIDVNECLELNNQMSLCKNAKCINTVGSYQCACLPGFKPSDKPNYCVEAETQQTSTHTQ